MMFTMQEPFYGILLSSMIRKPSKTVGTIGVCRTGNVFTLLYDEAWVKSLTVNQALTVLKHEVLHLAFNHFSIWEDENPISAVQKMRNIAADLEVNGYLDADMVKSCKGCLASDFGWNNQEGTREYFSRLVDLAEKQKENENKNKNKDTIPTNPTSDPEDCDTEPDDSDEEQCNSTASSKVNSPSKSNSQEDTEAVSAAASGSQPDDELPKDIEEKGKCFDDHSEWPKCTAEEAQQLVETIDSLLDFAAQEVEKSCGSIPSEMVGRIEKIRKKPKPVADWKRYFRRYLGNEFTELLRKSKKRESKRFPDAAGNRHQRKSNILVAIDTSSSVSMPEYKEFFGQIKTLTSRANFHVVECDARIQHEYDYRNAPNEILHGGGGTSFQPPVDMFLKNRKLYDALVYFTDGYATIPADTPKDTIWVISSNGDQSSRKRYQVNGAKVAFIPKHN